MINVGTERVLFGVFVNFVDPLLHQAEQRLWVSTNQGKNRHTGDILSYLSGQTINVPFGIRFFSAIMVRLLRFGSR
jgi:hypothetical protein